MPEAAVIFVDGRLVGTAERVGVDAHRGKLTLEGLDGLATLFFTCSLSPVGGGPDDPPIGWIAVRVEAGRWIDAPAASVFSFSSGMGDLVLMSAGLRFVAETLVAEGLPGAAAP